MKKIIAFSVLIFYGLFSTSCSLNDDFDIPQKQALSNANYVKNQLVGNWKYWGRFFVDRNKWIATDVNNVYYYDFRQNQTFSYDNKITGDNYTGTFEIIPATQNSNPHIVLKSPVYTKKILLLNFSNNYMSIFESPFEERYVKQ